MLSDPTPHYEGPLPLDQALSALHLAEAGEHAFTRDGPRADVEYRDLGLAQATGGRPSKSAPSARSPRRRAGTGTT